MSSLFRFFKRSWRWLAAAAFGLAAMVAIALGSRDRRMLAERDRKEIERIRRNRERDNAVVAAAIAEQRAKGEAARARARAQAEEAEWSERRANVEKRRIRDLPPVEREQAVRRIKERLRKSRLPAVVLGLVLATNNAGAAEPIDHPKTLAAGWWMDDAEHAETAEWLAELEGLRAASADLKASNAAYSEALDASITQSALSASLASACRAHLELVEAERSTLLEQADHWYRRPAVLLGVGFAGGILLTGAIVWGVR